jgi:hypothetical protein
MLFVTLLENSASVLQANFCTVHSLLFETFEIIQENFKQWPMVNSFCGSARGTGSVDLAENIFNSNDRNFSSKLLFSKSANVSQNLPRNANKTIFIFVSKGHALRLL